MKLSVEFNDTADLTIVHPVTGEEMRGEDGELVTVTIYGAMSEKYRTAKNEALNKSMARRRGQGPTAEQINSDATDLLAKCTKSFNHPDLGDVADARRVYRDAPWLQEQVDLAIENNALFLQADSKKSKKS